MEATGKAAGWIENREGHELVGVFESHCHGCMETPLEGLGGSCRRGERLSCPARPHPGGTKGSDSGLIRGLEPPSDVRMRQRRIKDRFSVFDH